MKAKYLRLFDELHKVNVYPVLTIGTDDVEEWIDDEAIKNKFTPEVLAQVAEYMNEHLNEDEYNLIRSLFQEASSYVLNN